MIKKVPFFCIFSCSCQFVQLSIQVHPAFIPSTMPCFAFTIKQQNKLENRILRLHSRTVICYTLSTTSIFIHWHKLTLSKLSLPVLYIFTQFNVKINIWIRSTLKFLRGVFCNSHFVKTFLCVLNQQPLH